MDFYDRLTHFKNKHGLGFGALGAYIELDSEEMQQAVAYKTLSTLQIRELEAVIRDEEETAEIESSDLDGEPGSELSLKRKLEVIAVINAHEEEFFALPEFRTLLSNFSRDELYLEVMNEIQAIRDLLKKASNTGEPNGNFQ